ncbi:DUF2997 domain-containing protein [Luteolibacter sp. Populi]|uniref:DUF2997 domain-containing protein n=1 Tax=Luteolibacter sp. Populi TaxID=3230487 RepID=UPI00346615F9
MSRRILVRVSPSGDIQVEAEGFQGKGCEAATQAIERALGKRTERTLKPEHRQGNVSIQQQQTLGGS